MTSATRTTARVPRENSESSNAAIAITTEKPLTLETIYVLLVERIFNLLLI